MNTRNLLVAVFVWSLVAIPFLPLSHAAGSTKLWSRMCESCHDGKTAPDKESLRSKYQTVEAFTTAVRAKGHRCMNILKNDESLIGKIGREIGLKESDQQ
jgi:hypothetical protein